MSVRAKKLINTPTRSAPFDGGAQGGRFRATLNERLRGPVAAAHALCTPSRAMIF